MNLVLGKFTPEHFSRFSKKFGSVEVELKSYLAWNSRDRLKFRTWIKKKEIGVVPRLTLRTSRSCEEFQDLFSAMNAHIVNSELQWSQGVRDCGLNGARRIIP